MLYLCMDMFQNPLLLSFFQQCWELLNGWDTWLFLQLNQVWTHPFLDAVFPWWRESNTWIPVYLFFILLAAFNFKEKALPWILFAVITVVLTDQISSSLLKPWVARPRPCQEPGLVGQVRLLLNGCSGAFSFTSSHATNHFGFAMFIYMTTRHLLRYAGKVLFWWAASICYAQVYVGVHYPLDVLCGALLGCGIGYGTASFFNSKTPLPTFMSAQSHPS